MTDRTPHHLDQTSPPLDRDQSATHQTIYHSKKSITLIKKEEAMNRSWCHG